MSTATIQAYAVYLTAAETEQGTARPIGYVVNRVLWDGASAWTPDSGCAVVADPDGLYPIGSTYTASTATTS